MAWLFGWKHRKKITVQDAFVDSDLADFPAYIFIDADADFHEARADGHDIRFTMGDGKTLLKYEREHWIGGNGSPATAHFWVKIPSILASGGATIYVYYGKSDAPDGEDAPNVWDANFKGVWHFGEGSGMVAFDKSGFGNDGNLMNMEEADWVDGKVGKALEFDGVSEYVNIGSGESLKIVDIITIAAWLKPPVVAEDTQYYCGQFEDTYKKNCLRILPNKKIRVYRNIASVTSYEDSGIALSNDVWTHVVYVGDGSNFAIYFNGIDTNAVQAGGTHFVDWNINAPIWIGGDKGTGDRRFDGLIDEVRISNIARLPAWQKFDHHNISEADNEITWGVEEGILYSERLMDAYLEKRINLSALLEEKLNISAKTEEALAIKGVLKKTIKEELT